MIQTITLGGRDFRLKPLTLGQLRPLLDALDAASAVAAPPGNMIDTAVRILQAGLAGAHPNLTPDELLALEATVAEVNAAVAAVLRLAGLVPREESPPGEAGPVAERSASGSACSTAPSPPAAAIPTAQSMA
jgi:hypothetical protein